MAVQRSAMMTKRTRNNAVLARKNRLSVRLNAKRNVAANASATEDITAKAEEYLDKAKTAWAENESKPTTLLIAGAAVTTLVVADGMLNAVEKLPLVPALFELIGIGFTAWFVYRY